MGRSSAQHVTAAAAHLFLRALSLLTNTAVAGKPKSKPKPRFLLQNRTETDRKRKIQNRNNTSLNSLLNQSYFRTTKEDFRKC